jgi:hypothetical protein
MKEKEKRDGKPLLAILAHGRHRRDFLMFPFLLRRSGRYPFLALYTAAAAAAVVVIEVEVEVEVSRNYIYSSQTESRKTTQARFSY